MFKDVTIFFSGPVGSPVFNGPFLNGLSCFPHVDAGDVLVDVLEGALVLSIWITLQTDMFIHQAAFSTGGFVFTVLVSSFTF